jgi:mRNA interferase RelE/StbE
MYDVSIKSRAERALKRLDRPVKNRIVTAILSLASDPRPSGCLKVKSEEGVWRIRVGDYRIGYTVDDAANEVVIIRIGQRSEFYD